MKTEKDVELTKKLVLQFLGFILLAVLGWVLCFVVNILTPMGVAWAFMNLMLFFLACTLTVPALLMGITMFSSFLTKWSTTWKNI